MRDKLAIEKRKLEYKQPHNAGTKWPRTVMRRRENQPVADMLSAAKAIAYCGTGIPVQMPWRSSMAGTLLIIDLFGGMGGTLMAMVALGVRCIAVHVERDKRAIAAVEAAFPRSVLWEHVETFEAAWLDDVIATREIAAVLVSGKRHAEAIAA